MITNVFVMFTIMALCVAEYSPVSTLDLPMYMGRWYQMYKDQFDNTFQKDGTCAVADYSLTSSNVTVLNSQLDRNGVVDQISGYAFYQDKHIGGQLTVQLEGVPRSAPYWVIELGPIVNDQYDYSIVSDNNRVSLFVLARNVSDYFAMYDSNVQQSLISYGFTTQYNKPIPMIQTDCDYDNYDSP